MEKQILENAKKDIFAIKDIINRTTDAFVLLGRIFIGWGLGFLVFCAGIISMYLCRSSITNLIRKYPLMPFIPAILVVLTAFASYFIISGRRKDFEGLTKPLLIVWMLIITSVTVFGFTGYLPDNLGYFTTFRKYSIDISYYFIPYTDIVSLLLTFAFGLLCIRLFTNLKFAGMLSVIYSVLAILGIMLQCTISLNSNSSFLIQIIAYCIILPATFLIVGVYLEFYRVRRN